MIEILFEATCYRENYSFSRLLEYFLKYFFYFAEVFLRRGQINQIFFCWLPTKLRQWMTANIFQLDSNEMSHNATDVKDLLSISLMIQEASKISERHKLNFVSRCHFNPLGAKPTKLPNTLKQFVGCCQPIVWVCLTILWSWRLKG